MSNKSQFMGQGVLFLHVLFIILVLITGLITYFYIRKKSNELSSAIAEKNLLKTQFDQIRLDKLGLDEHIQNLVIQEKTYKVAYEDWKAKYEWLDLRYQQLKHDLESKPIKANELVNQFELPSISPTSNEKIITSNSKLSDISNQQPESLTQVKTNLPGELYGKEILNELKSILDQHLQIIGGVIGDEKLGSIQQKNQSFNPLYYIEGIDHSIALQLNDQGIQTLEQLANISKSILKKWHFQFEELDETIINSWPFQATAILNSKKSLKQSQYNIC